MPARFSVVHQTAAGPDLPIINLTGSAAIRVAIVGVLIGSDATPADVAGEFIIDRTTDAGIGGTALTENLLDPLSTAQVGAAIGGTFSTAPTDTANSNLIMIPLNQRATFTWWAREGFELLSTATTANGLMLNSTGMSSGTPNMNATLLWQE